MSTVKFGVTQGSLLGLILFLLFCNDLPDIVDDGEGDINIYADDTTIYVDAMTTKLNTILLSKVYDWCCLDLLIPYSKKTKFLLMVAVRTFVGSIQEIRFGKCRVLKMFRLRN